MKKNIRRILLSIVTLAMVLGSAAVMQTVKAENTPGIEVTIDLSNAETTYWDYDDQKYYPGYFLDGGTLPIVTVTYNGDPLTEGVDYSITFFNWTRNETSVLPHLEGKHSLQVSNLYGSEYTISAGSEMFGIVRRPTYNIIYNANNGTDDFKVTHVKYGSLPSEQDISEFTYDGLTFAGWYTDSACSDGKEFDETAAYNGEGANDEHILNVYAKWTESTPDEPIEPDVPVVGEDWKVALGFSLMIFSWIYMASYVIRRNKGLVG